MKTPFFRNIETQDTLLQPKKDSNAEKQTINYIQKFKANSLPTRAPKIENAAIKVDSLSKPEVTKVIYNNNNLIDNYINYKLLNSTIDSTCYIINKQKIIESKKDFIIESDAKSALKINRFDIIEKPDFSYDWVFIPSLLSLIILASITTFYRKYIGQLFEGIFYRYSNNKILSEKNKSYQRLTFILDSLYIISFALAIDQIIKGFGFFSPPENYKYIVFIVFVGLLIALKLFRILTFRLSALFSNYKTFLKDLFNTSALYTRTLGILLVPLAFLMSYSTATINHVCVYTSIVLIVILLILRTISMIRSFILGGVSIFYFILYLCALEIVPLLILFKEVKSR